MFYHIRSLKPGCYWIYTGRLIFNYGSGFNQIDSVSDADSHFRTQIADVCSTPTLSMLSHPRINFMVRTSDQQSGYSQMKGRESKQDCQFGAPSQSSLHELPIETRLFLLDHQTIQLDSVAPKIFTKLS